MKATKSKVSLVPVLAFAVVGLAACNVEVPTDDSTTSGGPTTEQSSPGETPSVRPSSTVSGVNSRSRGGVEQGIPKDYALPQDIEPGTCYLQLPDTYDLSDATPVDCAEPHAVEIMATFTWPSAYADTIVSEYDNQRSRCEEKFEDVATAAGLTWVDRGASGSYEGDPEVVSGVNHRWFPSAAQLKAGEGVGYCAITPTSDSALMAGSLVGGTYQGYVNP